MWKSCKPSLHLIAQCAPNANCYLNEKSKPFCACDTDPFTNLPVTGNPYVGCAWDISGIWEFEYNPVAGVMPWMRLQSTEEVLDLSFMRGLMFRNIDGPLIDLYPIIYVDVESPSNIFITMNEGYLDNDMRIMAVARSDGFEDAAKMMNISKSPRDLDNIVGLWKDNKGSKIDMVFGRPGQGTYRPDLNPSSVNLTNHKHLYWMNHGQEWQADRRLAKTFVLDKHNEETEDQLDKMKNFEYFFLIGVRGVLNLYGLGSITLLASADGVTLGKFTRVEGDSHIQSFNNRRLQSLARGIKDYPPITTPYPFKVKIKSRVFLEKRKLHWAHSSMRNRLLSKQRNSTIQEEMREYEDQQAQFKEMEDLVPNMKAITGLVAEEASSLFKDLLGKLPSMKKPSFYPVRSNKRRLLDLAEEFVVAPLRALVPSINYARIRNPPPAKREQEDVNVDNWDSISAHAPGESHPNLTGINHLMELPVGYIYGSETSSTEGFLNVCKQRLQAAVKRAQMLIMSRYPLQYSFKVSGGVPPSKDAN